MKKLLTFLLTALLAFGVGWAAQLTYTFTSQSAGTLQGAPTGVTASFTQNANGYTANQGVQLTSAKNTLTLTIKNFTSSYKLTGITLKYCTNSSKGAGNVTAKLGNTDVATPYSLNSTGGTNLRDAVMDVTETAFNGSDLVLTVTASVNSVYVNKFTITYAANSSTPTCATPTFSPDPEDGPFTSAQNVTISCSNPSDATIYFTTDGTTPTTSSSVYNGAISVTSTKTIKAIAVKNGYNNSEVAEATYEIDTELPFTLVTDASTLQAGDEIIFVSANSASTSAKAMSTTQNSNNRGQTTVTVSGNPPIVRATSNTQILTLEGSSAGWYFKTVNGDNSGYLYTPSGNNNYLRTEAEIDLYAKATISITSGVPQIYFEEKGYYLRHNSSSSIFSCYSSNTSQNNVYIYRRAGTPKVDAPVFSPEPGEYPSAQEVTISCPTDGATIHYTYNGGPEQTGTSPITLNVNSYAAIVAWATLADYENSEQVTATYTINLTPTLTASPNPLNINDDNTSGGRTGYFTVTGDNLGTANVGLTRTNNEFTPVLEATTGNTYAGEYNGTPYWGFTPAGSLEGKVYMTYNGHALSATTAVNLSNGNNASAAVNVNYLYTGPIYLFGNIGVDADHINNFDFSNGVAMTRNTTDGTYSVNITAVGQNGSSYSWMYFSKNQGQESDAEATKFGPISDESYWPLQGAVDYTGVACALDQNLVGSSARTIRLNPGEYTVEINPNNNTFTISALVHAPVISLAPGTYSGTQEVTITCATPGAAIYYTTDGSEPSANNGTLYDGNAISISESVTLKAVAVSNGVTSSVASAEYLITPPFVAKDYEMLTSETDLVAGQTYLIVYKTANAATEAHVMGPISGSIGTQIEVTENNGLITSTEAMAPVTLVKDENNWTLLTRQGILYYSGSSNSLNAGTSSYTWTINKVENSNKNTFAIRSNTHTSRYLQYNSGSPRFACYDNASQQHVYIYKESSTPAILANPTTVSIELAAGEAQGSNTFTVGGRNLSEAVTLTLSAEDQAKGFSLSTNSISQSAALAGNVEVTVTYNGPGASETASITLSSAGANPVTVNVTATREPLTVTISPASCNFVGSVMSEPVTITANVPGATIEYSLDNGTTWQTYTDGITITIGQVNSSVTVMARATLTTGGNTYTSATVSETYTRQPKGETLYEKVTDESQIKAGEKYVIVYEGTTPAAFNGIFSESSTSTYWGSRVEVSWKTQNQVVDISNTDAIVFTLGAKNNKWTLNCANGYLEAKSEYSGLEFVNSATSGWEWNTINVNDGYGLTTGSTYYLRYNAGNNNSNVDRGPFRLYNNQTTGVPAYLYVLRPAVLEPVITPATGEYSEHQDVTITAENGTTIYYTTDGSDPTSSSTPYEGQFTVHYDATSPTTTIKAIAVDDEGNVSTIAEVVYTWIAPKVTIRPASREVYNPTLTVVIGCNPVDATIYYTTDGSDPSSSNGTLYEGPFEVTFASLGDQVTVKAIAYNDDDVPSTVDAATYTYAEKVINVDAPFFSPLEGKAGGYSGIYYGDQTLEIATSTANADIYYEIEPVSGTTPPSSVSDPTKSSTHYTGPISMTVGNSYRVKAIAYIGDFASTISEGYYTILPFQGGSHVYQNLKDFNDNCPTGVSATFVNPVQVVYHSTYTNNGEFAEYCYLRDNTDYACVYFGKRDTHDYHIFSMGDWLDGSEIAGMTNIWKENGVEMNFHIQLGTSSHEITSWPTTTLGNSEILPEEITNAVIVAGTADDSNSWGHYVHLRNTTLRNVQDYSATDPKHTGLINDGTDDAYYYDKFYRWSAGTCSYNNHNDVINHLGDYDQAFFDEKQAKGATFDVYGIVDYYAKYNPPFEICPLDFLWVYKPVITPASNDQCTTQQVVDITVETPEWNGAVTPTIYYKTDDMDDWAEFIGPFVVNSDTHVQAYAELPSTYGDMMRSVTVETEYKFIGIKDPIITPDGYVIEVVTGDEVVTPNVTISTNPESPDAVTLYTTNGEVPTLENGTVVENGEITLDPIKETTTVTAISYIEVSDGQGGTTLVWSKPVTQTYTFVKSNGVVYDLVNTVTTDKVYVIVNKEAYMGMSTAQNGNNRGSTGVKFVDDATKEQVYGNDELALFVLESANAGRYYFKNINGNGYLTVTTNDVANLSTSTSTSTYSEAGVTIAQSEGYPATIMFNYDGTNRYLRYFDKGRTFTTNSDVTLNKDVFLYGTAATPLAVIESETNAGDNVQVTVADDLIGAWAINKPNGEKYLWAKDMGYSIDKTEPVAGQVDYVKDVLGFQHRDWDQSNWVIIDFSNSELKPEAFVGKKIAGGTLTGLYAEGKNNGGNYRIVLVSQITPVETAESAKYPGYQLARPQGGTAQEPNSDKGYVWYYNTYGPTNFLDANLNAPYGNGFVADNSALGTHPGEKLFFMNPKVQEVARISAVYAGNDIFTVYEPSLADGVNGWNLKGAFTAKWDYNTVDGTTYGKPSNMESAKNYGVIFHAVVVRKADGGANNAPRRANADPNPGESMSDRFDVYPLDYSGGDDNKTAVLDLQSVKSVVSVRYYNVMGMESEQPFEGINIVVTRYSDGSASTVKVLR